MVNTKKQNEKMRVCTMCKESKSLNDEFYKALEKNGYFRCKSRCKKCFIKLGEIKKTKKEIATGYVRKKISKELISKKINIGHGSIFKNKSNLKRLKKSIKAFLKKTLPHS